MKRIENHCYHDDRHRKETKMFNLRSENGVHIVRHNGEEKTFLSFLNALNYISNKRRESLEKD